MKPTEVVINGTAFLIQPMDPFEAVAVFGDLQRDILPAAGGLLSLLSGDVGEAKEEAAMADAIARLSQRLDGKQLTAWVNRLLTKDLISVEINGNLVSLDAAAKSMAFKEFTDILELMFHAIRVWFAGPLVAWVSRTGLAQKFQAGGLLGNTAVE